MRVCFAILTALVLAAVLLAVRARDGTAGGTARDYFRFGASFNGSSISFKFGVWPDAAAVDGRYRLGYASAYRSFYLRVPLGLAVTICAILQSWWISGWWDVGADPDMLTICAQGAATTSARHQIAARSAGAK